MRCYCSIFGRFVPCCSLFDSLDNRRGLEDKDKRAMSLLAKHEIDITVVATKLDLVKAFKVPATLDRIEREVSEFQQPSGLPVTVIGVSSRSGLGMDQLYQHICKRTKSNGRAS